MKKLLIIALILSLSSWAGAADQNVYLDNAGAGAGSEGDPYGEFSEINWTTGGANSIFDWVDGGDTVFVNLKKGVTWREKLTVGEPGASGRPITLQAYSSGDSPVISGADIIETWSDETGNVWSATLATEPKQVFFDNTKGTNESGACPGDLNTDQEWCWDSNTLYQYVGDDEDPDTKYTSPGTEASIRDQAIYASAKDYIIIDGIDVQYAGSADASNNIEITNSDHVTIQNLVSQYAMREGILIDGASTYCIIDNVTAHHNGDEAAGTEGDGIMIWGPGTDNNTVSDSTLYSNIGDGVAFHAELNDPWDGPENGLVTRTVAYSNGEQGIDIDGTFSTIVEYCETYANGTIVAEPKAGIYLAAQNSGNVPTGNIVRYNYCHDDLKIGIAVYYQDDFAIYGNVIDSPDGQGVHINFYIGGFFYNNTIFDAGDAGLLIANYISGDDIVVKNNVISGSDAGYGLKMYSHSKDNFTSDYNIVDDANFGRVVDDDYYNLADWRTAFSQDANSIASDPLLSDPANGSFLLKNNSPAIDAGIVTGYDGLMRGSIWPDAVLTADPVLYGNAPDIGAYIYQPGTRVGTSK